MSPNEYMERFVRDGKQAVAREVAAASEWRLILLLVHDRICANCFGTSEECLGYTPYI